MVAENLRRLRGGLAIVTTTLLAACANDSSYAPPSAHRAWAPPPVPQEWRTLALEGSTPPAAPDTPAGSGQVDPGRTYDLPALVNMAQLNNPVTRLAWSQARQAASAIGLTEAAYLPMLSANVMGGYVATRRRLPEVLGRRFSVDSSVNGAAAMLGVEWLLFDFGRRDAAHEAARNLSLAANFSFNAVHQQLAYDVARTYYALGAAQHRSQIAREELDNSRALQAAAVARQKSGLATSVEVAQARQLVAQAQLQRVTAEGTQRNAYQLLLDQLGVPYDTRLQIADPAVMPLPKARDLPEGGILQRALADRPDIMASIASLKAAQNAVDVARADYAPKVYLAGFVLGGNNDVSIGPISGLANSGASRGVIIGMSLPLYDGGIRRSQVYDAEERVNAARATLDRLRAAAVSEIIVANNLLENALASHEAASELVETATLTYEAALDSYKQGLGTVTVATEAASVLLAARGARVDAHAAALTAAASLALALGKFDGTLPQTAQR